MALAFDLIDRWPGSFHPHQFEGVPVDSKLKDLLNGLVTSENVVSFSALVNEIFTISQSGEDNAKA